MSRDVKYSFLAEIIEADSRFEQRFRRLPLFSSHYVDPFCEDKAVTIVINQVIKKGLPCYVQKNQEHKSIFPTNDTRQTDV